MLTEWKRIKTNTKKFGLYKVIQDTVQLENAQIRQFSYIHYNHNGVCILPVLTNGDLVLIRQYRHALGSIQIEAPAGMIEDGEEPTATAVRELREETGLVAKELVDCGFIYPSPGSTNERMYLYIAYCEDLRDSSQELDPSENIEILSLSQEEVTNLIKENILNHAAARVLFYKHVLGLISTKGRE